MKRLLTLLGAVLVLAGFADPFGQSVPAPTGVTATIQQCYGTIADVRVSWTIVPGSPVTRVVASLPTNTNASSRGRPYSAGFLLMPLAYAEHTINVVNWAPNGTGTMTASVATTVTLDVAKKDCPKGRGNG